MALNVVKGSLIKSFVPPPPPEDSSDQTSEFLSLTKKAMGAVLEHILTLSSTQKAGLAGVIFAIIFFAIRNAYSIRYPSNLPRIREPPGSTRFSIKTTLAYYNDCKRLFDEAYHTVRIGNF